jgi:hypothetical protein
MWIYTKKGFYSIVQDRNDPSYLIVRARIAGDIEKEFPGVQVQTTPESDYLFRARVPRGHVMGFLEMAGEDIDYDNFKNAIDDHKRRSLWYLRVWETMSTMQEFIDDPEAWDDIEMTNVLDEDPAKEG